MARNDTPLLVVASGIASELKDLSSEVFKDGSEVNWGCRANAVATVRSSEVSTDTGDGELETSADSLALRGARTTRADGGLATL